MRRKPRTCPSRPIRIGLGFAGGWTTSLAAAAIAGIFGTSLLPRPIIASSHDRFVSALQGGGGDRQMRTVLDRLRSALGRADRDSFGTLFAEGIHQQGDRRSPFFIRIRQPLNYQTLERNMVIPEYGPAGRPIVNTINGKIGWLIGRAGTMGVYVPAGQSRPVDPKPIVARREVLRIVLGVVPDLLVDSSLVTFRYDGQVGTPDDTLDSLAVSDDTGPFGKLFISAKTGLPKKLEFMYVTNIPQPTDVQVVMHYGEFRGVSRMMLPFTIASEVNGQLGTVVRIERYTVNGDIPETLFSPRSDGAVDGILPPIRK